MKKIILVGFLFGSAFLFGKEYEIKMLDLDEKNNSMVFEPAFLHLELGDTVKFLPINKGHSVESKIIPEGAKHFMGELDKELTVTFDQEGIYIYVCPPHALMNMVGMIQVGKAINLADIEMKAPKLDKRVMNNKGRLLELIKLIK